MNIYHPLEHWTLKKVFPIIYQSFLSTFFLSKLLRVCFVNSKRAKIYRKGEADREERQYVSYLIYKISDIMHLTLVNTTAGIPLLRIWNSCGNRYKRSLYSKQHLSLSLSLLLSNFLFKKRKKKRKRAQYLLSISLKFSSKSFCFIFMSFLLSY